MPHRVDTVVYDELTSDPTAVNGESWYNTTSGRFKFRENGADKTIANKEELDTHTSDTGNPHTVTAAQVSAIPTSEKGVANGVATLDAGSKIPAAQIPAVALPEMHVVADATERLALTVQEGDEAKQTDDGSHWIYDGASWHKYPGNVDNVTGPASADDNAIARYHETSGKIIQNSDVTIDDSGNIAGVGNINEIDITSHGFRHNPDETDGVTVAAPIEISDSTNDIGDANSLARSNHQHAHGDRGGGTLHSTVSTSGAGFYPKSNLSASSNPTVDDDVDLGYVVGSRWLNTSTEEEFVCLSNTDGAAVWISTTAGATTLKSKSGKVLAASFSGNPKKATVTFSSAFPSDTYSPVPTPYTTGNTNYNLVVESITASSFVINLGSNSTTNLTDVRWVAIMHGEE